jgi:hypothetical protein
MDFDDLFERRQHRHRGWSQHDDHDRDSWHGHDRHGDRRSHGRDWRHDSDHGRGHDHELSHLARRLFGNKLLLVGGAILVIVALAIVVLLLLPLLGSAFDYVGRYGLKDVFDRIWLGSGSAK